MSRFNEYIDNMDESGASVWTNPKIEQALSKVGFDIPKYPKTGKVTLNGEEVGWMDNFNGLSIDSKNALQLIKKTTPKVAIWNPNDAKNENLSEGKGLSDSDLPKIADTIIRYFVGNTESAAKQLKSIKNKGFAVAQDVIDGTSGKHYVDLMNKYNKQLTTMLKSMKKDFEG